MKNTPEPEKLEGTFFGSKAYLLLNGGILFTFIVLVMVFRKRAMALADIATARGRKANKVAGKRLKKAAKLMAQGKAGDFYDEVMRALWGYVGDKLAMPVEQLTRDNIAGKLQERGVAEEVIKNFIEAIDECEYARFAPGDATGNMQKTYDKATDAITTIEDNIR